MKTSIDSLIITAALTLSTILVFASAVSANPTEQDDTNRVVPSTSVHSKIEASPGRSFFVNGLIIGSVFYEDDNNRLTSRDSRSLLSPGLGFRGGAVIENRYLLGGLFQANWRSTQTVLDSYGGDDKWGAVSNFYIGPEFRYLFDFGLYAGASTGLSLTLADNHLNDGDDGPECSSLDCVEEYMEENDDHMSLGFGIRGVIGYEQRFHRNFAVNAEIYVGWSLSEDEDERSMSLPTYGLGFGVSI